MRVAIYARVSTAHEQKPEIQLALARQFAEARSWRVVEEIVDHGYSGGSDRRPGLQRLLKLARSRKIDCVLISSLDRLFRSLRGMILVTSELVDLGVALVSLKESIDLSTSSGRLMLGLVSTFAEFERELVRERTLAGLAHARAKGKILGRPVLHDPKLILQLRSQGKTYREICEQLGCSPVIVRRAIEQACKSPPVISENDTTEDMVLQSGG